MSATTIPSTQPATAPGLLSQVASFVNQGYASGWQTFGTSSAWDPFEQGQDIGLPLGTPILGVNGATVTGVNRTWAGLSGGLVEITDEAGNVFRVGHVTPNVQVGQKVSASDIIGFSSGQAGGQSSGPHIEFQVQPNGLTTDVDPIAWLKGLTVVPGQIIKPVTGDTGTTTTTTTQTGVPVPPGRGITTNPSQAGFGDLLIALVLILIAIVLFVIGFRLLMGNRLNLNLPGGISVPPEMAAAV